MKTALLVGLTTVVGAHFDHPVRDEDFLPHHSLVPSLIPEIWPEVARYWEFGGSAIVTDTAVRLTPSAPDRVGFIWNMEPLHLFSWEMTFDARVYGPHRPGADGFALWYAANRFTFDSTPERHLWGGDPAFSGFAVVFDTYDNDAKGVSPVVSVIKNNGETKEWDVPNDLAADAILQFGLNYRSRQMFPTPEGPIAPFKIRLLYMSPMKTLLIYGTLPSEKERELGRVDLDVQPGGFFGFTGLTGSMADVHEISNVKVRSVPDTDHPQQQDLSPEERARVLRRAL